MNARQVASIVVPFACALGFISGCGGTPTGPTPTGGNGGGGNSGGTPPPVVTTGLLRVSVDSGCAGKESSVQVYVDGGYIGLVQPGDSGTSTTVSIGDHSVSATGQRGVHWGPIPVNVASRGSALNLTCTNTPPPATTATLRVYVDANCSGKAANIDISIDGVFAGTTQPGSSGVSEVVALGNHTIFARASNGTTWGTLTLAVPSNGISQDLTCR